MCNYTVTMLEISHLVSTYPNVEAFCIPLRKLAALSAPNSASNSRWALFHRGTVSSAVCRPRRDTVKTQTAPRPRWFSVSLSQLFEEV